MKCIFVLLVFAMTLVSGNVMPDEAVPLGTWRKSEQIEWESADSEDELEINPTDSTVVVSEPSEAASNLLEYLNVD